MADEIKDGRTTSEYEQAKSAGVWGIVGLVLSFVIATGSQVFEALHWTEDSTAGIIAASILGVASLAMKTLTKLGYIKGRNEICYGCVTII